MQKKWPNPMIFRKLLLGGFDISMSQNGQVEQNLPFHCCSKMMGWLHNGSIQHRPNPQVTPKDSQAALTSQNTTRYTKTLPQTSPNSIIHYRHHCLSSNKVVIWCVGIWGVKWRWSHHTISAEHWHGIFFSTWSFLRHQNTKTAA